MKVPAQKPLRLYNVYFPVWFLLMLPSGWLGVLPVNFVIDSLVVLLILLFQRQRGAIWRTYARVILPVWVFGFVADLIGAVLLFFTQLIDGAWWEQNILQPVMVNPFTSPWAVAYVCVAVAVSGVLVYFLNDRLALRRGVADPKVRRCCALALALATAPYGFLIPTTWLVG